MTKVVFIAFLAMAAIQSAINVQAAGPPHQTCEVP